MSPITHFLVGWTALERPQASDRDRALVVLAGLAPDLDGLGIVVDFATRMLGLPETDYYQATHRVYGHGLPAAIVISGVAAWFATSRARAALYAFIAVHLHFLCDILGSRGTGLEDIWGISYLSPFSRAISIQWSGQWPLVGWQNMLISAVLLVWVLARALRSGYTPLRLASCNADAELVATLRRRFRRAG
jgi:inner membrane protein